MGDIFFIIFIKSFRIGKSRLSETIEIVLACTNRVALIIEAIASGTARSAIACGAAFIKSETSFCDCLRHCAERNRIRRGFSLRGFANTYSAIGQRLNAKRIGDYPFYYSKIAAESANHSQILLREPAIVLKQDFNISKLRVAKFNTIQLIVSIGTQKSTLVNVTNPSTDLFVFITNSQLTITLKKLKLIDGILARYRPKIFTE
ncbi:MAG: hypothetical protein V7L25_15375 [Nostoc sp.]|uniref:hypothetical protein n=1 Tax=Nostoc sp. TaxID=1180 RepID=UPI002FF2521B